MTINNDQHIINQILEGDVQAFSILVDRYKNLVFTLALRMLKHREDAEEISQDVFIKVYKSLYKFKGDSKLSTWIYKVTYNSCLDAIKRQKRKHQEVNIDKYDAYDIEVIDDALEKLVQIDRENAIKTCIEALASEDSFILTLYYYGELSLEEISKITGLKANNIKVKLHRARKRLAIIMKQRLEPQIMQYYGK
ncbi:RNA polymerase sigma factor [Hyunsoonleella flava]|uniref:RNA polymerase sigma factor n=2 Tax=Hyunsoonleella flava TaxID=2527939 RepID=A0A4Q9FD28_9FLAO|nr:RNA polymerase sigma factor [Hyunsoonleella flava]